MDSFSYCYSLKNGADMIHRQCSGVCGDLSRVADDFMCRQCGGTLQEADLAEDLMVNGETYGRVKSICYMGDTLDGDDIDTTARIRNGWTKFRELLQFLTSRAPRWRWKVECTPVVSEAA